MPLFQLLSLLGLGFILGLRHVLDADHIVAMSTIVSETKSLKEASLLGAIWGMGHTTTLFLVGLMILGFKLSLPDKLALSFEFLVGIVLVLLGIDVLRKIIKERVHSHQHKHDGLVHIHFHSHKKSLLHKHRHKSFVVGLFHGLAGSAALMLLVLVTVKLIFQGLLYILFFGIGSILGMLIVSGIIGLPFLLTVKLDKINNGVNPVRNVNFATWLNAISNGVKILAGSMSIVLGFTIMYKSSFANGLF